MKKSELLVKLDELARRLRDEAKQVEKMRRDYSPSKKRRESKQYGPLEVTFPGEPSIKRKHAVQVFVEAIEKMDVKEVEELGIVAVKKDKILLVSSHPNPKRPRSRYKPCGGYYIYTNNSTDEKVEYLEEISKRLKIDMKIKRVPS